MKMSIIRTSTLPAINNDPQLPKNPHKQTYKG